MDPRTKMAANLVMAGERDPAKINEALNLALNPQAAAVPSAIFTGPDGKPVSDLPQILRQLQVYRPGLNAENALTMPEARAIGQQMASNPALLEAIGKMGREVNYDPNWTQHTLGLSYEPLANQVERRKTQSYYRNMMNSLASGYLTRSPEQALAEMKPQYDLVQALLGAGRSPAPLPPLQPLSR